MSTKLVSTARLSRFLTNLYNVFVPNTRKVNNKALSGDITLSASDVSAVPTTRKVNNKALSADITLSASDVSAVPTTRTVNNKALSADITLSASDVGALPDSTSIPSSASDVGAVPTTRKVNNKALSADITLGASDVGAVPTARKVNNKALSADITLGASDVGAIPSTDKGAASGVCPLNSSSKIDSTYLPSYVDDVIEVYPRTGQTELSAAWFAEGSASGSAITPETGKLYILMADSTNYAANAQFRWSGSTYVEIIGGGYTLASDTDIDNLFSA